MAIRLYFRATADSAPKILDQGFAAGASDGHWLSRDLDTVANGGGVVLAVLLDLADDAIEPFGIDVSTEETWDDETWDDVAGHWVKRPEGIPAQVRWYELPTALLRERASVRALARQHLPLRACVQESA